MVVDEQGSRRKWREERKAKYSEDLLQDAGEDHDEPALKRPPQPSQRAAKLLSWQSAQ